MAARLLRSLPSRPLLQRARGPVLSARSLQRCAALRSKEGGKDDAPPPPDVDEAVRAAKAAGAGVARFLGAAAGVGAAAMAALYAFSEYGEDAEKANKRVEGGNFGPRARQPRKASPVLAFINQKSLNVHQSGVSRVESAWINANDPMEDRHSLHNLGEKHGLLVGMFDGHSGFGTSDVLSHYLATYVEKSMTKLSDAANASPAAVAEALSNAFVTFDHDLTEKVPAAAIESQSRELLHAFVPAALSGAVACVALLHPTGIYVANTGDCRAVLGSAMPDGSFGATELSYDQTGDTPSEVARIRREHPGEEDTCVRHGRVLGGLQPSRAFGDSRYKWTAARMESLGVRIPGRSKTPPYVTAQPEVLTQSYHSSDRFLILATDGLWDVIPSDVAVDIAGAALASGAGPAQAASRLVEAALQGYADEATGGDVNKLLGLQKARNYRDDVTATVVVLRAAVPYAEGDVSDEIDTPKAETLVDLLERAKANLSPTAEEVAASDKAAPVAPAQGG